MVKSGAIISQVYTFQSVVYVTNVRDPLEKVFVERANGQRCFSFSCQWLPHHALVFFVPHLNPLLPLVLVEFVLVQNSESMRHHQCQKSCTETWLKCIYLTARLNWLMTPVFTSEGAAAHWTDSLVCGLPCCSRHTWPAPRRRPGGLLSLEGSRCHHLRCPPSPAGRRAAVWRPGLTPPTHPRGRTWHGT